MRLKDHILVRGLTLTNAARSIGLAGAMPSRTLQRWISGAQRPEADWVERITVWSDGAVTAQDMHETRLAWLRANRPERFGGGEGDGVI